MIAEKLRDHPYLKMVVVRLDHRPRILLKLKDGRWSDPMWVMRKHVTACHRAKIANGFDLSGSAHWGKTKAAIRQILLPRASQVLQLEGVKRMLADALARGQRALVLGSFVFWYEDFNTIGWLVKERAADGKAKPRHAYGVVEIPFEELDGNLVIGLFGELLYESE
ncbi:hypothetical protein [Stenotrophomonas maltophilia]|nr:hypothetical protein [Stenotrophomonas maltophilia]